MSPKRIQSALELIKLDIESYGENNSLTCLEMSNVFLRKYPNLTMYRSHYIEAAKKFKLERSRKQSGEKKDKTKSEGDNKSQTIVSSRRKQIVKVRNITEDDNSTTTTTPETGKTDLGECTNPFNCPFKCSTQFKYEYR